MSWPRSSGSGRSSVTPDGVTAHRWCSAAPDLLHADHQAAYWARVHVHHTGRTSKQSARDQARSLSPLPNGEEENHRRSAQMRQVKPWAKEMQTTRERLAAEQAERDAQAEQERAAAWMRSQQQAEERQAAEDDRRDEGLVISQHGPRGETFPEWAPPCAAAEPEGTDEGRSATSSGSFGAGQTAKDRGRSRTAPRAPTLR